MRESANRIEKIERDFEVEIELEIKLVNIAKLKNKQYKQYRR